MSKRNKPKKTRKQSRQERYITQLAKDLRKFREREIAGEKISEKERRNMRARERRVMKKMKETSSQLIEKANEVYSSLYNEGIDTLTMRRTYDDFQKMGRFHFSLDDAKSYSDVVEEITRASNFLNAPDTNMQTGKRETVNLALHEKYGSKVQSLSDNTYVQQGLIASEKEASIIFANYRRIEEFHAARIGKAGNDGVYGSDNLILFMIDVHNRGLDELEYGLKALEAFDLEQVPEFQEVLKERNKVTGITGLFEKGGIYGKLEGLL